MGIFIGDLAYSIIQDKEALYRGSMDFDTDSLACVGAIRESKNLRYRQKHVH